MVISSSRAKHAKSRCAFPITRPSGVPLRLRRAIIAESGRSDIGRRFYEGGPKKGTIELGRFLALQMEKGKLRQSDPIVAAHHLMALLDSETITPRLFGIEKKLSKAHIREAVARALDTFLAGYRASGAPPGAAQPR